MNKISLCMIAKNEEKNIGRCLASACATVDEIIVVDTGSVDKTAQIARHYGAKVQNFLWNNNFSDARNVSLELATGDWILILDADEQLAGDSRAVLRRIVEDASTEGYFLKIVNYLGEEQETDTYPDLVFRLFRNKPEYRFRGAIHEQIVDVILEKNKQAKYQIAADAVIFHFAYLNAQSGAKEKRKGNLAIISQEVAENPGNMLLRYHYGLELFRNGQFEQAAREFIAAANGLDPNTIYMPKLVRYIVLALHSAKQYERALKATEKGILLYPNYADLYYCGGLISLEIKEYGRAYDFFQNTFLAGEQPAYYAPLSGTRGFRSYYYLGRLAEIFCNEEEAIRYYFLSISDNPRFTVALDSIIRILNPSQEPESAQKTLERLFDFCSPQTCVLTAKYLFNHGAYALAQEYFERGLQGAVESPEILLWKGICLCQQKRFFEALRVYDSIDPRSPIVPLVRLNKLIIYWLRDQKRKVRQMADELYLLGLSEETGRVVALLQHSAERVKKQPITLGESGMYLLFDIVSRAVALGEKDKAQSLLAGLSEVCVKANSRQLGDLFYRHRQYDLAEGYLRRALLASQDRAAVYFRLAEICHNTGRYVEAEQLYRQAQAADPREPKHFIRLIQLYDKMRQQLLGEAAAKYPDLLLLHARFQESSEKG